MAGKTRRRGDRDLEGATKATILLLVAGKGEQSFTEIRLYLRDTSNIRSPKNLRIHLAGLAEAGLIVRHRQGPGKADTYDLRYSYKGIKALFNFFKSLGRERELMATPRFSEYVCSQDFQYKVVLGIIRTCILQAGEKARSAEWRDWLEAQVQNTSDDVGRAVRGWVRDIREGDRPSVFRRNFTDLLARYRTDDIDAIYDMFFRLLADYRQIDPQYRSGEYMTMVNEFILPTGYREQTFAMMRISPAACDYVLNRMENNPLFPSPKLMGPVLELLALFPEVYDFTIPDGGNTKYLDAIDKSLRRQFIERAFTYSGEPSTYMMVKSLFIHDLVFGRLACDEVPDEIMRLVTE